MGIPDHLPAFWEICMQVKKQVGTRHGTIDWFQIGKGVHQGCILSPCLLTYMQTTSREMLGWMKHNLESSLLGEISTTSDIQMTPLMAESQEQLKSLFMKVTLASWKKSYDQPRQHFKKQRHYFAYRSPYYQSCGFSSSRVWMWELTIKKGWGPKNGCFQTMVLEKTLENPLTERKSNQSALKEINPKYSLDGLMLKL